jgi:predicted N-acetyltransferase YhbS
MFDIQRERPEDWGEIEHLLDLAFGPDRFTKTVYRLREGIAPVADLCFVAREGGVMRGSLRFWPIRIETTPALLLGPLAVDPAHRGRGAGIALMRHALDLARQAGHRIVVLVGDEPYYARVGFSRARARHLKLPGPVDEARLLALNLVSGALDRIGGMIAPAETGPMRAPSAPAGSASFAPPAEQEQAEHAGKRQSGRH